MKSQNYTNHSRFVPGFHFLLGGLLVIGFIVSLINLYRHMFHNRLAVSLMLLLIFVCGFLMFIYIRQFAIKAQDRAIRAEENLRYFILSGKAIDSRITMSQIIALRFASDNEFVALCDKAAKDGLSSAEIKQAVQNWRADDFRV